jgi:hypothetical protein
LALYTILTISLIVIVSAANDSSGQSGTSQVQSLPKGLATSEQREKLFRSFVDVYNARDYSGILEFMSPSFRVKNPENTLPELMERIYKIANKIDDGAFGHFESGVSEGGPRWYKLYYGIRADSTAVGTLTLTIRQQGTDPYVVDGFAVSTE